ncbi:MAG: TIGR02569 family protein, partial [Nakamurella sp.]
PGVRIARPVRSSDGRWVIAGWTAHRYVAGRNGPRFGDVVDVGTRLHAALADIPRPRFLDDRDTLWSWADRISWGDIPAADPRLGDGIGAAAFAELAAGRRPVDLPHQLVHGDLTGNVLFAGSAPPAVIDMTPYWRPVSWSTAIVVVDAIAWGGANRELATGRQTSQWRQVLRRALLCRLAVSLGHPGSTPSSMVGVLSAVEQLRPLLNDELPGLAGHAPDVPH